MSGRVVNIRLSDYDVYIGRAGHGHDGYFGNPAVVGEECVMCGQEHMGAASTLPCFADYFIERLFVDTEYRERVAALRGKRLGCFCAPRNGLCAGDSLRCHGQIILRWLERET
jgi:hypothetical protein